MIWNSIDEKIISLKENAEDLESRNAFREKLADNIIEWIKSQEGKSIMLHGGEELKKGYNKDGNHLYIFIESGFGDLNITIDLNERMS